MANTASKAVPGRKVRAVHGKRPVQSDPAHEVALAKALRGSHDAAALLALFQRFGAADAPFDLMMRRV